MTLRKIPADAFVRRIKQVLDTQDKSFAFFLGAGCSISSGIPAAGALVRDVWLPKLRDLNAPERSDLSAWAAESFADYDAKAPALLYGELIDALFLHPEERQREIERLCEGRFPAFGYAVLARMMEIEGGKFNVALTTNFDDLIADALYLYTSTRPLIIHHESLASFIRPTRTRPLVVKLHGDHRLSPQNTSAETERLKGDIGRQVRTILHDRGLIIMGYAGNDQGIRDMLDGLPPEALPLGIYWVSGTEPECALREWLERRDAVWVEHGDFDQLMLLFRDVLDLRHPDDKRFETVFRNYRDTYQRLSGKIAALPETAPSSAALKDAVERADSSFPDWVSAYLAADRISTTDPDRADATYRAGLEQFADCPGLLGTYALFLSDVRKQYDKAEQYFIRALYADPLDADNLGNFARFIADVWKDFDRAEEYYRRALEADPRHANNLGNYASFLFKDRKEVDRAEEYYCRAVEADPGHANNLGNYASFLFEVRKEVDLAEEYYCRAVEADPRHANSLGNYAFFLISVRKDAERAEEYYRRALEVDPQHANNLSNYALLLAGVRKDADRAELYYRRALQGDPPHANGLGNYAFLLAEIRKDVVRAKEYYRLALEVDPHHANNLGNYAVLLGNEKNDADRVEEYYRRALQSDPEHATHLGNFAFFLATVRNDPDRAEKHYRRAVKADPHHANNLGNYAFFLANVRNDAEHAEEYFRRAVEADPQHVNNLGNYALFHTVFRKDADLAEQYYRRALEIDPHHANILVNYATFLANTRNDADGADFYYQRAVEADPQRAYILARYANFLADIRKDADRAEQYYRRAVELDPQDAIILGNYAGFLLARERDEEESELVDTALSCAVQDVLRVELLFYHLALHGLGDGSRFAEMKQLLLAGARSPGWNLQPHVERARRSDATFGAQMEKLATVISGDAPPSSLDDWVEWQQARQC